MAKKPNVPKIPLTQEELEKLSLPPHQSLTRLSKAQGDATDWYNVMFRITATQVLCSIGYCEQSANTLKDCQKLCERIFERECARAKLSGWLVLPDTEYHELHAGLIAADQAQVEMDRPTQVYAYKKAYAKCEKYIRLFDKKQKILLQD
jgi:hypothetical protein